jgi:signal transduction histidine kinase
MGKSLAAKLLIYFVLLNLLSILVVGLFAYSQAKDALISRTFDQLTSVRIEKKKRIEDFFRQCENDLQSFNRIDFSQKDFASLITNKRNLNKIYLFQSENAFYSSRILGLNNQLQSDSISSEQHRLFQNLLDSNHQGIFTNELLNTTTEEPIEIIVYKNILYQQNKAILAFSINAEIINNIMLDNNPLNGLGESGESYLVGNDCLLRSTSRFEDNSVLNIESSTLGVNLAFQDSIGTAIFRDYRDVKVLSSFSRVNILGLDWVILAEIDHQEAMIPIQNYGYNISYILIILSLLLLGVVAIIANTITAPLRKLRKETEKIALGIFDPITDIKADSEIMELTHAFNQMTKTIKEQQENLKIAYKKSISSMIDGQESERSRLAKELHDGLAQTILAIKMRIENTEPKNAHLVLKDSEEMFASLMHEIRSMTNDLMPPVLREFGLVNALRSLLIQIEENSNLTTELNVDEDIQPLNPKAKTYLYRIAQEAINNIIKHAMASHISIKITFDNEFFLFEISDNGIGIASDIGYSKSNGLSNIMDRVSVLEGEVIFSNNNPHGLEIQCKIPLKNCLNG